MSDYAVANSTYEIDFYVKIKRIFFVMAFARFFVISLKESLDTAVTNIGGGKYQKIVPIYPPNINLTPRAPDAVAKGE